MTLDPQVLAQVRRWHWQRISAMVLALCVLVHLITMILAVRGGLTATEILARTQDNLAFAGFYTIFVLAVVVHVPIGLATIAREWWQLGERAAQAFSRVTALVLLVLGLRAVWAVYAAGS